MEEKDFFINYENYINGLQERLFRLQVKYNEGQSWAYTDHEKGLLSDEDFYKINDSRMDTYVEGVDSKYILSREDVEFIAEYGALDVDGQLLKTILRKDLLDRLALIKQIFRSVVIFSYFDSFDGITKRNKFKDDVVKTFGSEKEKSVKMLERIRQTRGANYQNSPHFLETKQRLDNANKALRFAEHIITFDDDYLYRLLASYYEVKFNYYDWYRRMSLKEENDNGFVYQEHLGLMQKINGDISCLSVKRKTLEEEQGEARKVSSDLIKFLEAIADFDLTKFEEKKEKKSLFRRNIQESNKDVLFEVFTALLLLPGTFNYVINNLALEGEDKDNNAYDAKECFDKFFNDTYGEDTTFVSLINFVNDFRKAVTAYSKKIISQYESVIKKSETSVTDYTKGLDSSFMKALSQSQVISDIHLGYTGKESILLPGFTFEELESMYFSLKSYIIDNVNKESELEIITKKV